MTLPGGVFAKRIEQDRALIRTRWQWLWFGGFMLVLLLPARGGAGQSGGHRDGDRHHPDRRAGAADHVGLRGPDQHGPVGLHGRGRVHGRGAGGEAAGCRSWLAIPLGGHRRGDLRRGLRAGRAAHQGLLPGADDDRGAVHLHVRHAQAAQGMVRPVGRAAAGAGQPGLVRVRHRRAHLLPGARGGAGDDVRRVEPDAQPHRPRLRRRARQRQRRGGDRHRRVLLQDAGILHRRVLRRDRRGAVGLLRALRRRPTSSRCGCRSGTSAC